MMIIRNATNTEYKINVMAKHNAMNLRIICQIYFYYVQELNLENNDIQDIINYAYWIFHLK